MTAHFELVLDTTPPANPGLLINGGAAATGSQNVLLTISTSDYDGGAADVSEMKIWGDVDFTADALVQPAEAASPWQVYQPSRVIRLSAGSGRKTIYARLKDDVCNATVVFSDWIDLNTDLPNVTIVTPVDRAKISKTAPCDEATFAWQADRDFVAYMVRAVPNAGSPHNAGVLIATTHGSANTSGTGAFPANTPISTLVNGGDLEAASPGDTAKCIKVFCQDTTGAWSA